MLISQKAAVSVVYAGAMFLAVMDQLCPRSPVLSYFAQVTQTVVNSRPGGHGSASGTPILTLRAGLDPTAPPLGSAGALVPVTA